MHWFDWWRWRSKVQQLQRWRSLTLSVSQPVSQPVSSRSYNCCLLQMFALTSNEFFNYSFKCFKCHLVERILYRFDFSVLPTWTAGEIFKNFNEMFSVWHCCPTRTFVVFAQDVWVFFFFSDWISKTLGRLVLAQLLMIKKFDDLQNISLTSIACLINKVQ